MIQDEDVVQISRGIPGTPVDYTDAEIASRRRQIFRGIPLYQLKDAHPVGCKRHKGVFKKFNAIPRNCFDCYKVFIAPRTVVELFKLLMIFGKIALPLDNLRKCMVECSRFSGTYKGYVYCRSIEEGNEVCEIIRKAVSEDISPNVSVTLKRGCSEFALAYPQYAQ